MSIESKLIDIVTMVMGLPGGEVTADSTLIELGADSLDEIEILMMVEETFSVEILDADAEKLTSIRAAVEYITKVTA